MKIAHVITRMIIGGAQENTLLNCLDLVRHHGDEVLLICGPSVGPEGDLLQQNGLRAIGGIGRSRGGEGTVATHIAADVLPVRLIDSLRRNIHPWHDLKATQELQGVLRHFNPDVVHTHSAKGGLLGRSAAWRLNVPAVVHSVHGAPFHAYQSAAARQFFIRCERWAAHRCHHMISVADAMTDLMVQANVAPPEKFTTILSGMDVEPFVHAENHRDEVRKKYGLLDHHVVIGKIARLFHLKGHADLIAAAAQIVATCPDVRFLLVGDGILKADLQRQIASLGLTKHFVFVGLVPPGEVPGMIGAMDMLVHASYREGLARALPQSLIAGRPVISYDIDGAREVVIDDETGFLVSPGDLQSLAARCSQLATNAELRSRLGRAGQGRFAEAFAHQTMTQQIRDLYSRLLDSRS